MPGLFRHPVARVVTVTALVGSLADWVLFATLVVTVDQLLGGGPWATALVLLVRIVPGVLFAPLAARRVDGADLRQVLRRHEVLRVGAVATLLGAAGARSLPLAVVGLVALEFAAAMQAAARESTISRHVPPATFTALNTATAVLAYGMLPVGPLVVAAGGAATGWAVALAGYGALVLAYHRWLDLEAATPSASTSSTTSAAAVGEHVADGSGPATTSWRRVTVAAALGVIPAVALFAVGPTVAGTWLGDRTSTAPLYAVTLGGGAIGFALANLRRARADVAMAVATLGLLVAAAGAWVPGLALLGVGAGAAYLDLQTRLQHAASNPSEFARAFAILKGASAAAVLGAPALVALAGPRGVLLGGACSAIVGAALAAPAPGRLARRGVRGVLRVVAGRVLAVEVEAHAPRVDGPAVVVSNHPHWLDGVVALLVDDDLRPVARHQRHLGARLGIWAADAVVTRRPAEPPTPNPSVPRRPAFTEAAAHLRAGGRIWLAPEGGAHTGTTLRPPRSGAVRMAHLAGAPIQPLAIHWVDHRTGPALRWWRPWARRRVRVTWGSPVTTTGDVAADNDRMMAALASATGMALADLPPLAAAA